MPFTVEDQSAHSGRPPNAAARGVWRLVVYSNSRTGLGGRNLVSPEGEIALRDASTDEEIAHLRARGVRDFIIQEIIDGQPTQWWAMRDTYFDAEPQ